MDSCRLCLDKISKSQNVVDTRTIYLLEETVKVQIKYDDKLKRICDGCLKICKDFHTYLSKVRANQCRNETDDDFCIICCDTEAILIKLQKKFNAQIAIQTFFSALNVEDDEARACESCFDYIQYIYKYYVETKKNQKGLKDENPVKQEGIQCSFCDEYFPNNFRRDQHIEKVHVPKDLRCKECGLRFRKTPAYLEHMFERHLKRKVKEEEGSHLSEVETELEDPQVETVLSESSEAEEKYISDKFEEEEESYISEEEGEENEKYICDYCSVKFANKETLKNHFRNVHNFNSPPLYTCDLCQVHLARKDSLLRHFSNVHKIHSSHLNLGAFKCQGCGLRYQRSYMYQKHIEGNKCKKLQRLRKKEQNKFVCDVCNERLATPHGLTRHKADKHSALVKRYLCRRCHQLFKRRSKLNIHKPKCIGVRGTRCKDLPTDFYLCEKCDDPFKTKRLVLAHQRDCNYIRPQWGGPSTLTPEKQRLMADNCYEFGERFVCGTCGTSFALKANYNQHFRIQHLEVEYLYCDCHNYKFANKSRLRHHLTLRAEIAYRKETGQAFECALCEAKFYSEKFLRSHVNKAHEQPKKCHICGEWYKRMRKHIREAHVFQEVPLKVENLIVVDEILDD